MPPLNTGVETIGMMEPPPSEMEVDYDKNITTLYAAITSCEWDKAIATAKESPKEAQTWVVRHYENEEGSDEPGEIMWRFLPIHSACARQPPASVISALIKAYPDGARCLDDQGMYPLHYACGNQASREVIRLLLVAFPQAAKMADPRGMLPIHYLACWGPSSVSIIDMILVANRDVSEAKDADGNTALDLARDGEYAERDSVVAALRRWLEKSQRSSPSLSSHRSPPASSATPPQMSLSIGTNVPESKPEPDTDRSPRTASRLRHELTKLKTEYREMEEQKERETNTTLGSLRSKVAELEAALEEEKDRAKNLEEELTKEKEEHAKEKENSTTLSSQLQEKEELLLSVEERLTEATQSLVSTEEERDELNAEVLRIGDQRDHHKRRHENINNRLGSLTASLTSMAEVQSKLNADFQDREARLQSAAEVRRAKLQALIDFETQLMVNSKEQTEEAGFAAEFDQQQKEMDAIAAVIAAMRN